MIPSEPEKLADVYVTAIQDMGIVDRWRARIGVIVLAFSVGFIPDKLLDELAERVEETALEEVEADA